MLDRHAATGRHRARKLVGDGRLARTSASGDPDDEWAACHQPRILLGVKATRDHHHPITHHPRDRPDRYLYVSLEIAAMQHGAETFELIAIMRELLMNRAIFTTYKDGAQVAYFSESICCRGHHD